MLVRFGSWFTVALTAIAVLVLNAPHFLREPDDIARFRGLNFFLGSVKTFQQSSPNVGSLGLLDLVFVVYRFADVTPPRLLAPAIVAAVVALSLAATFLPRVRPHFVDLFALWSAAYFLVYPAWEHHYLMLLPALVLLVVYRPQHRVLALAVFLLLTLPTPYYVLDQTVSGTPPRGAWVTFGAPWPDWAIVVQHATKPLPALAFWAWLALAPLAAAWRARASVAAPVARERADAIASE